MRTVLFAVVLGLLGCSAGADFKQVACEAGATQACVCDDGAMGAQVCAKDGTKWGDCSCATADGAAAMGSGGSSGSGAQSCSTDADCPDAARPYCLESACSAAPMVAATGDACDGRFTVCQMTDYCNNSVCTTKLPNRAVCDADKECASGVCMTGGICATP